MPSNRPPVSVVRAIKRVAMAAGLVFGLQGVVHAASNPYYVYGIDGSGLIREIKLQNKATGGPEILYQKTVLDTKLPGPVDSFNGLSYDIGRDDLFFAYGGADSTNTNFYWWDKQSQSIKDLGSFSNELKLLPTSAAFYDDAIWFFQNGEIPGQSTAKLFKIGLTYDGAGVPTASAPISFTVSLADPIGACTSGLTVGSGSCNTTQVFGDIAINSAGKLYAATANNLPNAPATTSDFYTIDLTTCGVVPGTCGAADNLAVSGLFGYQLSFGYGGSGIDDATLIGTKGQFGELGLVSLLDGSFTPYSGSPQNTVNGSILRDLAGPAANPYDDAPGPLPLLGAGAAFGWSRRLRQRIRRSVKV